MTAERRVLALIVAAGLALRLAFLYVHQTIERDGTFYASIAEHLARSGRLIDLRVQLNTFYPPGYPALVGLVYLVVGDSHRAGQLVSLVGGLAVIALVFALARRLAGSRAGLVAAAFTALYPPFAHSAVSVHTEALYTALLCLLLLVGLHLVARPGLAAAALAGALVGALYLVRPEGLLLAGLLAWLAAVWGARREPLGRIGTRCAVFLLALLLLAVPYVIYLRQVTGSWLLSGKGLSYRIAEAPGDREAITYGPERPRPWRGLRVETAVFGERYVRNLIRQEGAIAESVSLLALGLAAIGLIGAGWRARAASEGVMLVALAPLALYPAFEVVARWTEPAMVVVFVLAARGIVRAAGEDKGSAMITALLVALVAARYAPQLVIPLRYGPEFEPVEQRDAGLWVRDRFGPGATVMCRPPEIAYYARARWVPLPYADIAETIRAARQAGAGLLVLDELHTRRLRPALLPLLDGPPPAGLTLLHQTDRFPRRRVRVFAVNPS